MVSSSELTADSFDSLVKTPFFRGNLLTELQRPFFPVETNCGGWRRQDPKAGLLRWDSKGS